MPAASLILNSPYAAPTKHWQPGIGGALLETAGRRPASYEIFDIRNNTRRSEPLERVNEIRARIDAALAAWVDAVNAKGGFGSWCADVAFQPAQIQDILEHHAR